MLRRTEAKSIDSWSVQPLTATATRLERLQQRKNRAPINLMCTFSLCATLKTVEGARERMAIFSCALGTPRAH